MMQTDVFSEELGSAGSVGGPTRLKAVQISYTGTTGAVEITDGATGALKFSFYAPATGDGSVYMLLPGEGIRFQDTIYGATVTDCTVQVFYG